MAAHSIHQSMFLSIRLTQQDLVTLGMRTYFAAKLRAQGAFFFILFLVCTIYIRLRDSRFSDKLQKRKNTLPEFRVLSAILHLS